MELSKEASLPVTAATARWGGDEAELTVLFAPILSRRWRKQAGKGGRQ